MSCTRIVKVEVPTVVGVPLIWPVDGLSVNPTGKAPETTLHDNGGVPPDEVSRIVYVVPTVPNGNGERLVRVIGMTPGGLTVRLSCLVAVPDAESVTFTMIVAVPAIVGVPEITPEGFNDNPVGNGFEVGSRFQR